MDVECTSELHPSTPEQQLNTTLTVVTTVLNGENVEKIL
jgi:hypothetical protein